MVLGVTGGVGAGKSAILKILKDKYHAHIIEADKVGHEVQKPGEKGWQEICKVFGKEILASDLTIDRKKLGDIVFADAEKLALLNRTVHPIIYEKIMEKIREIEKKINNPLIVLEAAILFETGFDRCCDVTLYIRADREIRIKRLMEHRGYTREHAGQIMKHQLNDEDFMKRADYVVENNGNLQETETRLGRLLWKFNVGGNCWNPIN